jgi:hypothetical protein
VVRQQKKRGAVPSAPKADSHKTYYGISLFALGREQARMSIGHQKLEDADLSSNLIDPGCVKTRGLM